jgi:hypothetical protein
VSGPAQNEVVPILITGNTELERASGEATE